MQKDCATRLQIAMLTGHFYDGSEGTRLPIAGRPLPLKNQ